MPGNICSSRSAFAMPPGPRAPKATAWGMSACILPPATWPNSVNAAWTEGSGRASPLFLKPGEQALTPQVKAIPLLAITGSNGGPAFRTDRSMRSPMAMEGNKSTFSPVGCGRRIYGRQQGQPLEEPAGTAGTPYPRYPEIRGGIRRIAGKSQTPFFLRKKRLCLFKPVHWLTCKFRRIVPSFWLLYAI